MYIKFLEICFLVSTILPNDISFTQPENMCFWWEGSPGEQEGANCGHKKLVLPHQNTEKVISKALFC